ncbi:MAG: gliding motility-associated C-terminal domain-containing protein, partial [Bacteroidota bacterium]
DGLVEPAETIGIDIQLDICNRDTFYMTVNDQRIIPTVLRSDTSVCQGSPVQLDGTLSIPLPDPPIFSNDLDFPIVTISNNDLSQAGTPPTISEIDVSGVVPNTLQEDVIKAVCVDVEHLWAGDVDMFLFSPSGQFIDLSTDNGGGGQNYTNTCFTPTATDSINFGSQAPNTAPPFTGEWLPEGDWSFLWEGIPNPQTNGTWQLYIKDDQTGIDGTLLNWSICFNPVYRLFYQWTPSAGLSCANCPNPIATPDTSTTYVLTVIDSYGCQVEDSVRIEVEPNLAAPENLNCSLITDNSITFSWNAVPGANSGYEVSVNGGPWMPASPGPTSHLVDNLNFETEVTIEVRAINICESLSSSFSCSTPPCTPAQAGLAAISPASCIGVDNGTASFNAIGGSPPYRYTIVGTTMSNTNGFFVNLAAGDYVLEVVDQVNCPARVPFTIPADQIIDSDPIVVQAINCNGTADGQVSVSLNNGTAPYRFDWSNGNSDSININLGPATYFVTITDQNGCLAFDSVSIEEPAELVLDGNAIAVTCAGSNDGVASVNVSGGSMPYTYQWDAAAGNQSTVSASNLAGGTYSVLVTDANNCSASQMVMVPENTPINLQVDSSGITCFGANDGAATVFPTGGAGNYTYQWDDPMGQTAATAGMLSSGSYTVIVTDEDNCSASISVNVIEPNALIVDLDTSNILCAGAADGQIALLVNGGTFPYSYEWEDDANIADSSRINLAAGSYAITVTDAERCAVELEISLSEPDALELEFETTAISCSGEELGTATAEVSGGIGPYTYQWDTSAMDQTTALADSLLPGVYYLTITDANSCELVDSAIVGAGLIPNVNFDVRPISCFEERDGRIAVSAEGGNPPFTYAWSNGASGPVLDSIPADTYYLSITDSEGCITIDSFALQQPSEIRIFAFIDSVTCFGDRDGILEADVSGGVPPYSYSLNEDSFGPANVFPSLPVGRYWMNAIDANGCFSRVLVSVPGPPALVVDAGEDLTIELGDSTQLSANVLNANGDFEISWEAPYEGTLRCDNLFDCSQPWASPQTTITYDVFAVDDQGCRAEDRLLVEVIKERLVDVPTGFSPNGDNVNDVLIVHGKPGATVLVFRVFDRWGNQVFEASDFMVNDTDPMSTWNGNFRGQEMNPGVYTWYAEVEFIDGFTRLYKGNTTLIR